MPMKSRRFLGMPMSSIGIAGLAAASMSVAGAAATASRYTDLRRIEPIHGDVAAGARKDAACPACPGGGAAGGATLPPLAGPRGGYFFPHPVSSHNAPPQDTRLDHTPKR